MHENQDKLISIIIPVYNVKDYLEKCIISILNQTHTKIEVIIIDDGSDDGSSEICDELAIIDKRIKVFHKKNGGLSSARNMGLQYVEGEYIGFVDSDDYVSEDMYESLISYMKQGIDIVTCGRVIVYPESCKKKQVVYATSGIKKMTREEALEEALQLKALSFSVCDKLFRREILEEITFPIKKTSEDLPFVYSVLKRSRFTINIGQAKYFNYQRQNSISRSEFSKRRIDFVLFSRDILSDVNYHFPRLLKQAEAMYIKNIIITIRNIENSSNKDKFSEQSRRLYKVVRRMSIRILNNQFIEGAIKKELLHLLLRKLFHFSGGIFE